MKITTSALFAITLATLGCSGAVETGPSPDHPATVEVLTAMDYDAYPSDIAVGPDAVFWIGAGGDPASDFKGSLQRVPKEGGTSTLIVGDQSEPTSLALAGTDVYWSTGNALVMAPNGAGPEESRASSLGISTELAVDGGTIFGLAYFNGLSLVSLPVDGTMVTTLPLGDYTETPRAFALTPTSYVWVTWDFEKSLGTLWALSRAGGTKVALGTGTFEFPVMVADATHAYWIPSEDGKLVAVPLAGGAPETIATPGNSTTLAIDDTHVYWGDQDNVMKVAKSGGAPVTVATHQLPVARIVMDDTHLYYLATGKSNGWEIRRIEK